MSILVTGGAGYIGSHVCLELVEAGFDVISVDNYSNSSTTALKRVEMLTNKPITQFTTDLRSRSEIVHVFETCTIEAVIHLAGLKAVGESVTQPIRYYQNNITGTLNLLEVMQQFGVKKLVFSSSATVYGDPDSFPIPENAPIRVTNPYGQTKAMLETVLQDIQTADSTWSIVLLRYFNPIGAHKSGLIGEDPKGIPNNLVPYITQVVTGKLEQLHIYGNDYDTPDGTGVRDYIHVLDLADGHVKALNKTQSTLGLHIYNLGTGNGFSVLEMVHTFETVVGSRIPYIITDRRPGDIPTCYADSSKAQQELGWSAVRGLKEMCEDAWRWQKNNPNGYEK
jgi:UDP-glucose 4-epimerase